MGDDNSMEDQRVLEVLLDDVEREPAVAVQGTSQAQAGTADLAASTPVATAGPRREGPRAEEVAVTGKSTTEPWRVHGASVALALETARERYGSVRVAQAYRRRNWWGRQEVVLELEPASDFDLNAVLERSYGALGNADGPWGMLDLDVPRAWSRSALREVGFPVSLLRRLPVEDPQTPGEWEAALRRIILGTLLLAPRRGSAQVHGQGARGAALMLGAAEQGFALGFLDFVEEPVTSERILQALRRAMPPWEFNPRSAPLGALGKDEGALDEAAGTTGGSDNQEPDASVDGELAAPAPASDAARENDVALPHDESGVPSSALLDSASSVVEDGITHDRGKPNAGRSGAKGRGRGRKSAGPSDAPSAVDGGSAPEAGR